MTALLRLGAHDSVLAALAGHRDLRSVQFYSQLDSSMIREAIVRLRDQRR
jgi:site-specific recombinase XerD